MVTIRNDIEANGNANRATDSAVDGSKNVNHLANGSRRSTMADIKPKAFNRKCVGLLALIVCVGVCFGVGMLFLYGHLVDRLNESASHGAMLHDKNGNPVKPFTTTTSTTTEPVVTSLPSTVTDLSTVASIPSTTEMSVELSTPARRKPGSIFFDSWPVPSQKEKFPAETTSQATVRIDDDTQDKGTKPKRPLSGGHHASTSKGDYSGDDTDDDDDDYGSGSGSGNNK